MAASGTNDNSNDFTTALFCIAFYTTTCDVDFPFFKTDAFTIVKASFSEMAAPGGRSVSRVARCKNAIRYDNLVFVFVFFNFSKRRSVSNCLFSFSTLQKS